jgi:hypothetical protein
MPPRISTPATVTALVLLVLLGPGAVLADSGLYEPRQADFPCPQELAYGKGDCNAYFRWIQTFYRGNMFTKGWTQYATQLLSRVADDARPRLAGKLNVLGQTIAAEWAKENSYRRIYSRRDQGYPNMQDLLDRLNEVMRSETGSGVVVESFLDTAQRVAEKAIRGEDLNAAEKTWK